MSSQELEVRVIIEAPDHLSLTEIAEVFWDKLASVPAEAFTIDTISVSTTGPAREQSQSTGG